MNRFYFYSLFLSFLICSLNITAQTQLKHQKKMYVDENGRFYTNKHLPLYLRLSHSPDAKAGSQLLKSESSPQYTNPFYFDTEGYNTIRTPSQVDTVTKKAILPKQDIIFEIFTDGLAPNSHASFSDAPRYRNSQLVTYYGHGLTVSLSAKDEVSGVEKIYYSVNGSEFKPYNAAIPFDKEKEYSLKYYAVDNVGNVEEVSEKKFTVDLTPPRADYVIEGVKSENTISPKAKMVLSSEDALSGLRSIKYIIDNGTPKTYSYPIPMSLLADGQHSMVIFGIDKVNNSGEDAASKDGGSKVMIKHDFYVDKVAPEVDFSVQGDQHKAKYLFVSPRSKAVITATDNKGGIKRVAYSINSSSLDETYGSPFAFNDKKGLQSIYYNATDKVDNKTSLRKAVVYYDNEAPSTGISYGYPKFFNRDTLFISNKTKISLFSKDLESGVKTTQYKLDNGAFTNYEQFSITDGGLHTIIFKATDNVNNEELQKESMVVVDNIPPEIFMNFSIKPIREESHEGKTLKVYPTYVKMYLGATDKYSGTKTILYSIDGGQLKNYSQGQSMADVELFTKEKLYTVRVVSKDKLGNESEKTVEFMVAKK